MSTTTTRSDGLVCVPRTGTLYDVLELILDRGMVIDVFVRVSLVGIEILKIDARVVVASVDTYLRFAEACNRLDLESDERSRTVPELFGASARPKAVGAKKAAKAVGSKVKEAVGADEDEDEEDDTAERSPRGSRSGARSRAVGASRTRRSQES